MMLRIIHGKLKPGTWDSYERAYKILPRLKPFFSGDYATTRCEVRFAEEFDQ